MNYFAHGLVIDSTIPFPELMRVNSRSDVLIRYEYFSSSSDLTSRDYISETLKIKFACESTYISWKNIEICKIINYQKILVNPKTHLPEEFLRTLLLGLVMGILLLKKRAFSFAWKCCKDGWWGNCFLRV